LAEGSSGGGRLNAEGEKGKNGGYTVYTCVKIEENLLKLF
jgi:hypothetical protein